jgi:predicted permease
MRLVLQALPASLPIALTIDPAPDGRVLAATLGFVVLGTLVSGLGPALHLARASVVPDLKGERDRATGRARRWRWLSTRDLLVTAQLALTLVMLTAAGLFVRGAMEAARSDPGFTFERGVIVNVDTSLGGYDVARSRAIQHDALARLRALPGVQHASVASLMPFAEFRDGRGVQRAGAPIRGGDPDAEGRLISATTTGIGADYFETLGIPLLRGRGFTRADELAATGERIAILDETLTTRLFGEADPIGQFVQFSLADGEITPQIMRVIGVAGGVRSNLFDLGPEPAIYTPLGRDFRTNVYFHVKTAAPSADAEASMLPTIRQSLRAVDPAIPIVALETRPMFRERNLLVWVVGAGARIAGALAAAALIVALVGVYGVKAYLVARRTREIGVRMALGARPGQVMGLIFRDGLVVAAIGLAIGLALSILAGWLVRGLLFQGRAFDLTVVVLATVALLATSILATWLPARRALRIQPTTALRDS